MALFRTIARIAALLLLAVATPALAQTAGTGLGPRPADPALWVVKDEDTTIYLFGSVHVLRPGYSWFDGRVRQAFDESDELVTEILERDFDQALPLFFQRAISDDGMLLSERLNADQLARYRRAMARIGLPARAFDQVNPWVPAFIMMAGCTCDGASSAHGVETVLNRAARQRRMPVSALENLDQQLGFFDNLRKESQIALLMEMVDAINYTRPAAAAEARAETRRLDAMWATADVEGMNAIGAEAFAEVPELREFLLPFRNNNWAQWIKLRLDEPGGKFFVAVGALHLHGPDSVQVQLASMGITAERVEY